MTNTKPRILLIEDRYSYQLLWHKEFISQGFEVEMALNEKEAMSRLALKVYDAAVIDVNLADAGGNKEGGLEVAHWIRAHKDLVIKSLPIVFSVANPSEEHLQQFQILTQQGAGDVLVKPFSSSRLRKKVTELLAKKGGSHE